MLAIIGGTGLYDLPGMEMEAQVDLATPFGAPSGAIVKGRMAGQTILFLARHGAGHRLLPHEVNYRANIYALKAAGATQTLGVSAVGSLAMSIAPGDLAMPSQYFDWTKGGRERSFFGKGVAAHVSTARPASGNLIDWVAQHAAQQQLALHRDVTYACVEGPRLGTRAESLFLQQAGCHIVGMTNVPEVFLAREAQMCYATIGIATDYDCWLDDPSQHVTVSAIFELYGKSLVKVRGLLESLLKSPLPLEEPEIRNALQTSMMTPDSALTTEQREWLAVLRR
jgi:5'-methylthioadenosine phosphorylase